MPLFNTSKNEKEYSRSDRFLPERRKRFKLRAQSFKDQECTFYLLNAYQLYHLTTDTLLEPRPGDPEYEKLKEHSETGLKKHINDVASRAETSNHLFETISTYGTILEAIRETVEKKKIELIVMGTKGENNPAQKIYGSTAVDVMEKIRNCPALIIPQNSTFVDGTKKEIVFSTNYHTFYKRRELAFLLTTARLYNAAIRVLHVQNTEKLTAEQEVNKGMLEDLLEGVEHSFHTLNNIKVVEGINSFIQSRGSHMLAIMNKKHNFFYSLFLQPLVKEVGYDSQVPVLVMHHIKK